MAGELADYSAVPLVRSSRTIKGIGFPKSLFPELPKDSSTEKIPPPQPYVHPHPPFPYPTNHLPFRPPIQPLPTRYVEAPHSTARSGDSNLAAAALDSDDDEEMHANSGALDVDLAEPTLAERLKALNVSKAAAALKENEAGSGSEDDSDSQEDGDEEEEEDSEDEEEGRTSSIPSTTLTTTLIQALHSGDAPLLESCLAQTSPSLIRATVKRLPSGSLVLGLLEVLVERLGRGKMGKEGAASVRRARGLVEWVRQVLVVHVGFLVTVRFLFFPLFSFFVRN